MYTVSSIFLNINLNNVKKIVKKNYENMIFPFKITMNNNNSWLLHTVSQSITFYSLIPPLFPRI